MYEVPPGPMQLAPSGHSPEWAPGVVRICHASVCDDAILCMDTFVCIYLLYAVNILPQPSGLQQGFEARFAELGKNFMEKASVLMSGF